MKRDDWIDFEGKNCHIETKKGRVFTCKVIEVDIEAYPTIIWFLIEDRDKNRALLNANQIVEIREEPI